MAKIRLALFASGTGSNALKIIDHFSTNSFIEVGCVISNKKVAPIVESARKKGIEVLCFTNAEVADGEFITNVCQEKEIDFIILAGYLRKIPVELLTAYSDKIINVHPSLLPKHGGQGMYGAFVHEAVLKNQDRETGITIHFVNEHFDEGRIIAQFYCSVDEGDTLKEIQSKIQRLEHTYFPIVIEKTILVD